MLFWNRIILLPVFFHNRVYPPPLLSHILTYPPFSISPLFSEVAYVTLLSNRYTQPSIFVVTNPTPPLASIIFIINCTPPYPYLYLWPPLTTLLYMCFLHLRLFLSVLTWSETKMNRLCMFFERNSRSAFNKAGDHTQGRQPEWKTGNRYRKIEIRLLLIA